MSYQSVLQTLPTGAVEKDLVRMAYKSKISAEVPTKAEETVQNVLRQSIKNNPTYRISGMLYFNVASYELVQVLEGPQENIDYLYSGKFEEYTYLA